MRQDLLRDRYIDEQAALVPGSLGPEKAAKAPSWAEIERSLCPTGATYTVVPCTQQFGS